MQPSAPSPATGARHALLTAALEELVEHGHAGISLRAVARRAGVSHAAPKHHFGDRAGLLTAVATQGFRDLATALAAVPEQVPGTRLAALGQAYIDYGLAHPALFDLMFRTVELDPADADLRAAQREAIGFLESAAGRPDPADPLSAPLLTVMAWALVHGLVVLARDGALHEAAAPGEGDPGGPAALAHAVATAFGRLVAR